jgi:hypothetical protein
MIHWKPVAEYIEPNWVKDGTALPPFLFWRKQKGAVLGYIRDEELFDWKWVYVCDANKVTHFSEVNGPESNVVDIESFRAASGAEPEA